MSKNIAVKFTNVSKRYRLYSSKSEQLVDVFGLEKYKIFSKTEKREHVAIDDVSVSIEKGTRLGIIGRNGSGKSTLLKLLCGNFRPSSGEVTVNGSVQALMDIGVGFHPEFTGRQNIEGSLQYNGLSEDKIDEAIEDIIDFSELGDYLDQPFKTYSLGMKARLMFAATTAISPDIMVVDEVLGAGDAYFVRKSRERMMKLIETGCTLIVVSHSMSQILELCSKTIWIDSGKIKQFGASKLVVRDYEEYIHSIQSPNNIEKSKRDSDLGDEKCVSIKAQKAGPALLTWLGVEMKSDQSIDIKKQSFFKPGGFNFLNEEKISRWGEAGELEIVGFTIETGGRETNKLFCRRNASFNISFKASEKIKTSLRLFIDIHDQVGTCVSSIPSPKIEIDMQKNNEKFVAVYFNPMLLGEGIYTISASLHDYTDLEVIDGAKRYDLLNKSFVFEMLLPDSLLPVNSKFFQNPNWVISNK